MIVRVEVSLKPGQADVRGPALRAGAATLGVALPGEVGVSDLFFLRGEAPEPGAVDALVSALLCDPVTQEARWGPPDEARAGEGRVVEVAPLPGVTDSEAESLLELAHRLGFTWLEQAATGRRHVFDGALAPDAARRLAEGLLANTVVQRFTVDARVPPPFVEDLPSGGQIATVALREADDDGLLAISRANRLSLDLRELQALRAHFQGLGRDPTDLELEMFAQTWSEHCVHKTFKARITTVEGDDEPVVVDSMYRSFIKEATRRADASWLRSVFVDNAGIVAFDDRFDLAFKVETHNHPSALEPFGGANTGVGGVVRDVIGVSARPIATTDVLCFGPPDLPREALPEGCLHPSRVADGVIAGVGDYGNKMGIPTVSGAVLYDPGYVANPLVYCGCLGILPRGSHRTEARAGDLVVVLGGRTGRDGLRGATFSSMEMDASTADIAGSSVQIGHPIHEKQLMEVVLAARDEGLYDAITDCGAGGLSSAVGEMAARLGAEVQLKDVPLKYAGLSAWEIWLSEAQERMVLAVPPQHIARLQELAERHASEVTVLGHFTGDGRLIVRHGEQIVGDLDMHFLHEGIPQRELEARWSPPELPARPAWPHTDPGEDLLALLATPDLRSKEHVIRRYDHEVQGGTVGKPLVGPGEHGPADAAVLLPLDAWLADPEARRGVALSVGINPHIGRVDPYVMALAAVDEAARNLVAVGADPRRIALLDNFCWGRPDLPDRLGSLVRCARGCLDAALALKAPYISGKDSLNNEYTGADGLRHAIPGTLLISALGIVPDVDRRVSMDLKAPGDLLVLLGEGEEALGASAWARLHGVSGGALPSGVPEALARYEALHAAILAGWVRACHDLSEGGLALAAAEMCLAGRLGATLDLDGLPWRGGEDHDAALLFGEGLSRLLIEVRPEDLPALREALGAHPHAVVGRVTEHGRLRMGRGGRALVDLPVEALERAFTRHLHTEQP